jgi:hypothetical protein
MSWKPLFVYVVEAENGMFKFGCSRQPKIRARGICANSPIKVRLVAFWLGDRRDEFQLHERFSSSRGWSEWFHPTE